MRTLHTRDGTAYGNAIMIRIIPDEDLEPTLKDYLKGRPMWLIETDYGNRIRLTEREIDEMFTRGIAISYAEWAQKRRILQGRNLLADEQLELA